MEQESVSNLHIHPTTAFMVMPFTKIQCSSICGEIEEFPFETSDFLILNHGLQSVLSIHYIVSSFFFFFWKKSTSPLNVVAEPNPIWSVVPENIFFFNNTITCTKIYL